MINKKKSSLSILQSKFGDKGNVPNTIKAAVSILAQAFGGTKVEIVDTEMTKSSPDKFNPNGMWGIGIKINDKPLFLTYELATDICGYGLIIAEDVVGSMGLSAEVEKLIQIQNRITEFKKQNK